MIGCCVNDSIGFPSDYDVYIVEQKYDSKSRIDIFHIFHLKAFLNVANLKSSSNGPCISFRSSRIMLSFDFSLVVS